jgi:hypothetical protein
MFQEKTGKEAESDQSIVDEARLSPPRPPPSGRVAVAHTQKKKDFTPTANVLLEC